MPEIIENVYRIDGGFVNAYLIEENGELTLVDALVKRSGKQIIEQIKALGFDPKNVKMILVTHSDGDHVGGVDAVREMSGAKVYAPQIEADAMAKGEASRSLNAKRVFKNLIGLMETFSPKRGIEVDEIMKPGDRLPILGGLEVVATPGHTPGHVSFYAPEVGVLFAGDSLRTKKDEIKLGNIAMITWDEEKLLESFQKQAELKPKIVCPGHGPVVYEAGGKFPSLTI